MLARTWPDGANIGVGCRASGIVGLDLDRHDGGPDGVAVFAALCRIYGQPWPDTLTVATPHSGQHLYFRILPGLAVASTDQPVARHRHPRARLPDRRLPRRPGSVVDGAEYRIDRDVPAAPLPRWLASLLTRPAPVP